jgi:hypothetical protein
MGGRGARGSRRRSRCCLLRHSAWRNALLSRGRDADAFFNQPLDVRDVAIAGCDVEWCRAIAGFDVDPHFFGD